MRTVKLNKVHQASTESKALKQYEDGTMIRHAIAYGCSREEIFDAHNGE